MSLEDAIREVKALDAARDREERNRPKHLWRDVVVMARELNGAMRLARKAGVEILIAVHKGQVLVHCLNEVEDDNDYNDEDAGWDNSL